MTIFYFQIFRRFCIIFLVWIASPNCYPHFFKIIMQNFAFF